MNTSPRMVHYLRILHHLSESVGTLIAEHSQAWSTPPPSVEPWTVSEKLLRSALEKIKDFSSSFCLQASSPVIISWVGMVQYLQKWKETSATKLESPAEAHLWMFPGSTWQDSHSVFPGRGGEHFAFTSLYFPYDFTLFIRKWCRKKNRKIVPFWQTGGVGVWYKKSQTSHYG